MEAVCVHDPGCELAQEAARGRSRRQLLHPESRQAESGHREGGRVDDRDGAAADSYEESRPGERGDQAHALPDRRERGVPVAEQLLGHEHGQQGREPRTEDEAHRAVAPFRPLRSSR
jgi:hypothetical protein